VQAHYRNFWQAARSKLDEPRQTPLRLLQRLQQLGSCCPALLLELDGMAPQVCVQPLLTLTLVRLAFHSLADAEQQARALRAIRQAATELCNQYESLLQRLPSPAAALGQQGQRAALPC
jgi:anti-sigma factor RsiW